ncbi:RhoGAP-domain-containing protein [Aspergillus piperis CBS 112811]|uniref:RhoGAP-domain-containing protein n=1 Tax=Aspergillus piperis CBS 112811 TaxID=1448313 RepID=A0A8G1QZV0_9EURO|nr:RhoGAP-domain-containing protein [Aspergillus piperis CBS 112811]RAH56673.1 RhoGAP-domain-containing protein [Aspergillus piperis CBS 112811]
MVTTGKSHPGVDPLHRLPPTAAPPETIATSPPSKRDLASWWRQFKRNTRKEEPKEKPQGIFGIPLNVSIKYANVAISLTNDNGESFIYGYVPIVVAKCGVYLKEKATDVEGIFRLSGSAKRIKDLQEIFDSPERYGKGLDWTGYTVHDAANVLRRYLNQLPEPIVPLDFYERFREPLRTYQRQVQEQIQNNAPPAETEAFDHAKAVAAYQQLIRELPPLNKQLLLYILDLLAVFASKSDQNRMTSANLSAIFQPGLLSHPQHDMSPDEYKLSQDVLIFLIENQDHFLFGMNGTAADEQTVKEVEGGLARRPTTHSNVRRSVSSASGGAESFRKYGSLRRNVSVSSKNSRNSNAASPATPTSLGGVGVHRSNTLPSKMTPVIPPSRYGRAVENTGVNSSAHTSAQHSRASSRAPAPAEDTPQPPQPQPQPTQNQPAPQPQVAPQPQAQQVPEAPVTPQTQIAPQSQPAPQPQSELPQTNVQVSPAPNQAAQGTPPPTNGQGSITEVVEPGTGIVYVHSSTHGPVPKSALENGNGVGDTGKPMAHPSVEKPAVVQPTIERPVVQQPIAQKPAQAPIAERLMAERPIPHPEQGSTEKLFGDRPILREGLPPIAASPPPAVVTPTRERKLSSLFSKSPPPSGEHKEPRQPNRLKKKRIPGSASESAQSSSQSLQAATSDTGLAAILHASRHAEANNDAGGATPRAPNTTSSDDLSPPREGRPEKQLLPQEGGQQAGDTSLRPYGSRTPSMNSRSSFTDYSDADPTDDAARAERKEHRRSWRFPRSSKRSNEHIGLGLASPPLMATTPGADRSTSSIGSWHHSSRSSPSDLQQFASDPSYQPLSLDAEVSNNGAAKDASFVEPEKRSLFGKFKAKVAQVRDGVKESTERDRTRSPVNSEADLSVSSHTLSPSGKDSLRNRPAPIDVTGYPKEGQISSPVSPLPGSGLPPAIPEEPRTPESPVAVPGLEQKQEPVAVPVASPPVETEGTDAGPGPAVPS